jgi:hypothetical protein
MMRFALMAAMVLGATGMGVSAAQAQRVSKIDGNKLLGYCSSKATIGCDAYLDGIADGIEAGGRAKAEACIPAAVTTPQMRDVVVKYLRNNPQTREMKAGVLATKAFAAAFPCKS